MKGAFYALDWQGKARRYVEALQGLGWRQTEMFSKAAFVLSDMDVLGRRSWMDLAHKNKKKAFLYPHAARPCVVWDGLFEPHPHITANILIAPGHADVLRSYGYPHPLEVCGWTFCALRPFQPTTGNRVLFGPIHPNANGWLSDVDLSINRRAFEILRQLQQAGEIQLAVQFLGTLEQNGLRQAPGVEYIASRADQAVQNIESADVVVSTQTVAYLAIARGVPTVMMGEDIPPRGGNREDTFAFAASWDKYRELSMYPLDLLATDDPLQLLRAAQASDERIREWRRLFIGEEFQPEAFVATLEKYL